MKICFIFLVLFSLVIFSVGLLGYAALQVANTKRSGDALNQVWTQYHVRQLADMMAANPKAMELGYFLTEQSNNNPGFVGWRHRVQRMNQWKNTKVNRPGQQLCYRSRKGGTKDPFKDKDKLRRDQNSGGGRNACTFLQVAGDYLYTQFAYNISRDLPAAAFEVRCDDIDPNDGIECSPKGSLVTITVIWSYDPTRQNLGADNRGCFAGRADDSLTNEESFSLTGDECVQYSFVY